ncbi:hypothetical protein ABIB06_006571 [Bradyrhizobium sp. LB8.2]|uniref:hypothetical protein n=1 Tax=unclassified Bradyrhizobium TaxID=2631580 RepID=UPI00339A9892
MEKLKLEAGKYYRTRDGRKAFVGCVGNPFQQNQCEWDGAIGWVETNGGCQYRESWREDGRAAAATNHDLDLVAEWKEPKRIKGWVNVFLLTDKYGPNLGESITRPYATREEADKDVDRWETPRFACIEIDVLEGQGLDGSARRMELPDLSYLKQVADHWSNAEAGGNIMHDCPVFTDKTAKRISEELKALIEYAEKASGSSAS